MYHVNSMRNGNFSDDDDDDDDEHPQHQQQHQQHQQQQQQQGEVNFRWGQQVPQQTQHLLKVLQTKASKSLSSRQALPHHYRKCYLFESRSRESAGERRLPGLVVSI